MSKRSFKKAGDVVLNKENLYSSLILLDTSMLHDAAFTLNREIMLARPFAVKQIKDETRFPFAVVVKTDQATDSCLYPVFLEIEQDDNGHETVLGIRVHLHSKDSERVKAPRTHKSKK